MSRVTSNTDPQLTALVADELAAIPRGGLLQNMYRMVYQQTRLNGLGRRAQIAGTAAAAHELSLRSVREHQPDFVPVVLDKLAL